MGKKVCRTSVALDQALFERVRQASKRHDVSIGWIIRKALERYLEEEEQPDLFDGGTLLTGEHH